MNLISRVSGRKITLGQMSADDRRLWRMKRVVKAFDKLVFTERLSVSFLTLTQRDEGMAESGKWIGDVMHNVQKLCKRAGVQFHYVAVLEIQKKRYEQYGVLAAHWHIVIATSGRGALPHCKSVEGRNGRKRIQKVRDGSVVTFEWLRKNVFQKLGMYFVCDSYSKDVYSYLAKYIGKGDLLNDYKVKTGKQVKVFSSSRIPLKYRASFIQVWDMEMMLREQPELLDLYWRMVGSKLAAYAKRTEDVMWEGERILTKVHYDRVTSISGEWILDGDWKSSRSDGGEILEDVQSKGIC